nr:hypothetical protein GCM10020092_032310 [Actinoplanes digitatis]
MRHARETVRFADGVAATGAARFLEVGPDAVLSAMVDDGVAALRRDRDEVTTLLTAVGRLWATGQHVDWTAIVSGARVDLPTYPFQRRRFWVDATTGTADPAALGLGTDGHPLLGAVVELPGTGGRLFTGRLSLDAQPWLADHAVLGSTLAPGSALVELALHAGAASGAPHLEELTLGAPLVLPAAGALPLQVTVGPDEDGRRTVTIHTRAEERWLRHAAGSLTTGVPAAAFDLSPWPPYGAEEVAVGDAYPIFAEHGYAYGPVFQGLRAAWRSGDDIYAEVALPELGTRRRRPLRHPPGPARRHHARHPARPARRRELTDRRPVRLERRHPARGRRDRAADPGAPRRQRRHGARPGRRHGAAGAVGRLDGRPPGHRGPAHRGCPAVRDRVASGDGGQRTVAVGRPRMRDAGR